MRGFRKRQWYQMLEPDSLIAAAIHRSEVVKSFPDLAEARFSTARSENWAVDDGQLHQIENCADRILEEVGLVLEGDPETLDLCRSKGFCVKGDRVRFDGNELRNIIRLTAPARFDLRARNQGRDTPIGWGAAAVFSPVYGPPSVHNARGLRSMGGRDLYHRLVELAHAAPAITNTGHMICVMNDVPEANRPYEMALAHLERSDKPFLGPVSSPEALRDVSHAVSEIYGRPGLPGSCNLLHLINSTPPLTYKSNPLKCLRTAAQLGEGVIVTSYMMLGATGPVTAAGALVQGYAEVLVGLALSQLWRPGTPTVMGVFGTPFDMRHMVPSFGDPVTSLIQLYSTALARRLQVPARGDGGITSAKLDDAQAGYEGGRATYFARASEAHLVLHCVGWLEQGRTTCFAKFQREARALNLNPSSTPEELGHRVQLDPIAATALRRQWGLAK